MESETKNLFVIKQTSVIMPKYSSHGSISEVLPWMNSEIEQ